MAACYELVKSMNPKKIYINFVVELTQLGGRKNLPAESLLEKHDAIQKGISEIMKKNGMGVNRFLVKKKDREIQIQDAFPEIREKGRGVNVRI